LLTRNLFLLSHQKKDAYTAQNIEKA